MSILRLKLLEPPDADALNARGQPWFDPEDSHHMRRWAGRHPFFLQLLGEHLVDARCQGEPSSTALNRFFDDAFARLRELSRELSEHDKQALRALRYQKGVMNHSLINRGLLTKDGNAFAEVLLKWLNNNGL